MNFITYVLNTLQRLQVFDRQWLLGHMTISRLLHCVDGWQMYFVKTTNCTYVIILWFFSNVNKEGISYWQTNNECNNLRTWCDGWWSCHGDIHQEFVALNLLSVLCGSLILLETPVLDSLKIFKIKEWSVLDFILKSRMGLVGLWLLHGFWCMALRQT